MTHLDKYMMLGKGLWCLAQLSTIFQWCRDGQCYWWRNRSTRRKQPAQFTDKLYYIMLFRLHLAWTGFELTTLVVIGTDSIGSLYMTLCLTYKQYIVSCLSNDKIIQTTFFTRDMIWLLKYIVNSLNLRFFFIK